MPAQPEPRWVRAPGWEAVEMGGEFVMMSAEAGEYYAVKGVAATLWQALAQPHDVDSLVALVASEYDVTAQDCRADVVAFVEQLRGKGMVRPAG